MGGKKDNGKRLTTIPGLDEADQAKLRRAAVAARALADRFERIAEMNRHDAAFVLAASLWPIRAILRGCVNLLEKLGKS